MLRSSVPREILDRKKTGFPVPYDSWMRNEMRDYVHDTVLGSGAAVSEYFDRRTVARCLDLHR